MITFVHVRRFVALLCAAALVFALGACTSGGDKSSKTSQADLAARLTSAQAQLDNSPALLIKLKATDLPDGTFGLSSASGRGYQGESADEAAFTGEVSVVTGGATINAEVIATEGKVWAKTKFTNTYLAMQPKQLGAANPADLFAAKGQGVSQLLAKTTQLASDGESRDGRDILTTISGKLSGDDLAAYLPIADPEAQFDVTYRVSADDSLGDATISGPFYTKGESVSYQLTLTPSDDDSVIEPPTRGGGQ